MVFTLMIRYIMDHFLFLIGYMGSIGGTFPKPLSAKEEEMYFKLYKEGDEDAKNVLIERNLRLVVHVAKKYAAQWSDSDDLISIGAIGLMKAVSTYDYEKGHRFATYAAKCVQNAILSQMRLWFRINPLRAEKHQNGVFWHRFPRIFTYSAPLRRAM
ncbi:MAG: sigma-70 family RNA polymerase sigma factor [Clostridia bacterium]|nr:sigma-70 family RNA polymerase sigma factor [Clostridia bacterium]